MPLLHLSAWVLLLLQLALLLLALLLLLQLNCGPAFWSGKLAPCGPTSAANKQQATTDLCHPTLATMHTIIASFTIIYCQVIHAIPGVTAMGLCCHHAMVGDRAAAAGNTYVERIAKWMQHNPLTPDKIPALLLQALALCRHLLHWQEALLLCLPSFLMKELLPCCSRLSSELFQRNSALLQRDC
jgi:hypothetical protein